MENSSTISTPTEQSTVESIRSILATLSCLKKELLSIEQELTQSSQDSELVRAFLTASLKLSDATLYVTALQVIYMIHKDLTPGLVIPNSSST